MAIKDRTSMYNTLDYWNKNISPKYYDMDKISMSRVSLVGQTNEVMADTTNDIITENSILFNEIFLKKAQLPESILTYAAQYRIIDQINAKPATMQFALGIREDILLTNSITDENGNSCFIIDSDSEIILEDNYKYMLDYDIKISVRKVKDVNIYSAQYIMNNINTLSTTKNPYIKITKNKMDSLTYLYLIVTARQVEKHIIEQTFFNEDVLTFISKDFEYNGILADFNVYYKGPNDKEYYQIEKLITDSPPVEGKFCYYQYKDNTTITISFSTLGRHFRPEFNSSLKLEILTTKGVDANFAYKGNNVRMNMLSNVYDYRKVIMLAGSLSDSRGAQDKLSYEELKDLVSYYASTSNNIGTTIDLNKYFSRLEKQSKLTFVKKRDDILDRLFTGYMLMRDENDTIIPGNTLDMHIGKTQFDSSDENTKRYVIKAGSKFIYNENLYELKRVDNFDNSKDKYRYSNPFAMVINKSPLSLSYYLNSMNTDYLTEFSYINDSSFYQFITNKIHIFRDAINGDDRYKIEFTVTPNISDIAFEFANLDENGKFVSSNDKIKLFGTITDSNNEINQYMDFKMIDYDKNTKEMKFKGEIITDDYISATNSLRIKNSLKNKGNIIPEILIDAVEMNMSLVIFYKDELIQNPIHDYTEIIPESKGYLLTNSYSLSEKVNLINDMTDIMRSTIIIRKLEDNNPSAYEYFIRSVPVTNYEYIKNRVSAAEFVKEIHENSIDIRDALKLITNNFSIDLKLYNTYGKSKYFYILDDKKNCIDRVNISIKLKIKLNPANTHNKSLHYDITTHVKDYIERINNDNNFYISKLIGELNTVFRDIISIEFNSINEYDNNVQSIEKNFPTHDLSKKNDMINFVPEYINIDKLYDEDGMPDYMIDIDFV